MKWRQAAIAITLVTCLLGLVSAMLPGQSNTCGCMEVSDFSAPAFDPTVAVHPYGHAVAEQLPWEQTEAFMQQANDLGATVRMAAFLTTLPDPLPGEEYNFAHAADLLAGTVVQPADVFSMNRALGPYSTARGYREGPIYIGTKLGRGVGGGVCKMATSLYNAAILADLPVLARQNHGMLVPYANPGQDATVSYGRVDLSFRNDTATPILIWADTVGQTLYVAVYGQRVPPQVTWHHEVLYVVDRPVVRRSAADLAPGEERVVSAGADGIGVTSWVEVAYEDGSCEIHWLGADWYRPMVRVEEYGKAK